MAGIVVMTCSMALVDHFVEGTSWSGALRYGLVFGVLAQTLLYLVDAAAAHRDRRKRRRERLD
ncbi:hypothetical protein [Paractinoplanes ferrugineus]|uniref:hypothetical protein n=1 Tax=Paractinoplanes ferrugineus TaxID=113564 RepID=UPI0019419DC7|nr:hypothetical protein [Actinoplanes ferrugineus]